MAGGPGAHAFLVVVAPAGGAGLLLRRAAAVMADVAPGLEDEVHLAPGDDFGWLVRRPGAPGVPQPLHTTVDERGELLLLTTARPAADTARIAARIRPFAAARATEPEPFCAVARDPRGRVELVTDVLGQLAPRVARGPGGVTLVASHDDLLAATGCVGVDADVASLVSAACADWSIGGRSLLAGVQVLRPWQRLTADATGARVVDEPMAPGAEDRRPPFAVLVEATAGMVAPTGDMPMDLTAGRDSRTLLAAALQVAGARRIVAHTRGDAGSPDVLIARRLARGLGIRHVHQHPQQPANVDLTRGLDLLAWAMNGDTSAKRALAVQEPGLHEARYLVGTGGEIFRRWKYHQEGAAATDAARYIGKLLRARAGTLGVFGQDALDAFERRIEGGLAPYAALDAHPHDVSTLFYLHERHARWGSLHARTTWSNAFGLPFATPPVVRRAFADAPVVERLTLHADAVATLPRAVRDLPYNAIGRDAAGRLRAVRSRLWRRATVDGQLARVYRDVLPRLAHDSLLAPGSPVRNALGRDTVEPLAGAAAAGHQDAFEATMTLLVADRWLRRCAQARSRAAAVAREPRRAAGAPA